MPFLAGGFGTFLMRQTISTIPDELIEAARLDGASEFRIFWQIVLPLCKPTLAALAIINIIWRWNDVLWPLLVTSSRDLYTVTLGLAIAGRGDRHPYRRRPRHRGDGNSAGDRPLPLLAALHHPWHRSDRHQGLRARAR